MQGSIGEKMDYELNADDLKDIGAVNDSAKLFSILINIMKKLRSPEGCMWDREQNHSTLKKSLIEEAYETIEAIDDKDPDSLKEELGDLLLQVAFHSQIADENKEFEIKDVLKGIIKKLYRRHPHVFSSKDVKNSKEILENWEDIKKKERKGKSKDSDSIFTGIPKTLPQMHYAYEVQKRASRLGFDWEDPELIYGKILEELAELKKEIINKNTGLIQDEMGDLLFSIINYSRHLGVDCEQSLSRTSKRFIKRFIFMEKYTEEHDMDFKKLSLKEKDKLWEMAKNKLN